MEINAAEATIDLLFREGLVKDAADLYTLEFQQVRDLERFGEKSANNLLQSIRVIQRSTLSPGALCVGNQVCGRNSGQEAG